MVFFFSLCVVFQLFPSCIDNQEYVRPDLLLLNYARNVSLFVAGLKHPEEHRTFFNERILQQLQLMANEPFFKSVMPKGMLVSIPAMKQSRLIGSSFWWYCIIFHQSRFPRGQETKLQWPILFAIHLVFPWDLLQLTTKAALLPSRCTATPEASLLGPVVPRLHYLYPQFIRRHVSMWRVPFLLHFSNQKLHICHTTSFLWPQRC